jgi:CheY-like chemotaxis protein
MGDRESNSDPDFRVLVIDDDVQVRDTVRAILERAGFEVAVAADGEEGLTLHGANPAHVVISDIIMPGKEGIETIIALRRAHPDRILTKPFSAEKLLGTVRDLLPPAPT